MLQSSSSVLFIHFFFGETLGNLFALDQIDKQCQTKNKLALI